MAQDTECMTIICFLREKASGMLPKPKTCLVCHSGTPRRGVGISATQHAEHACHCEPASSSKMDVSFGASVRRRQR